MLELEELRKDRVFHTTLRGFDLVFQTTWGLFSPRAIDLGTRLLIDRIDVHEGETCVDLGCGYGPIGIVMAKLTKTGMVHMVDKDFVAVQYAEQNVRRNRIQNVTVQLSNAFDHLPKNLRVDVIAANLPSNVGKELLSIILGDAHERLNPNGRLYIVTVNGLREFIKRNFRATFGNYKKLKQGAHHTVALAIRNES